MHRIALVRSWLRPLAVGVLLAGAASSAVFADVVTEWNIAMTHYSEMLPPPGLPPYLEARTYAMTHIATFNAVAEAHRKIGLGADESAAGAQAAHDVLVAQLPAAAGDFDALLATQLAAIPDGPGKTKGIQLGAEQAAAMLAARASDGSTDAFVPYTPGTEPGDYQFTPPFDFADAPKWGSVTPFVLKSGSQFRAPPPYKVTDLAYAFDLNQIKALGGTNSTERSDDQTNLALFWWESSTFGWNRVARILAAQETGDLLEHARLFAVLNAAIADAYITSFDSKYTYHFWRPVTAIHAADTDGNPLTASDPAWEPLFHITPPIPDYPSGHACAGGAASAVLIAFFGDERTFTLPSTMSFPFPFIAPRTFHKISDAAKENAFSRMYVGIHFRLACEAGYAQGVEVGSYVVNRTRAGFTH